VSAAMEGTLLGLPAFAVSLLGRGDFRFEVAARFARRLAAWVLERGLPPDTLLNVNVPAPLDGEPIRGFALTRMGRRRYGDAIIEKVDPRGKKYYWIGGDELAFEDAEGTDFHAVSHGLISVTPIHLDLTNYNSFDAPPAPRRPRARGARGARLPGDGGGGRRNARLAAGGALRCDRGHGGRTADPAPADRAGRRARAARPSHGRGRAADPGAPAARARG